MLTLLNVLFLLGKGFRPISMLIVVFYLFFFALNIHRDHIQVSVGVLLHPYLKKAFFKEKNNNASIFHNKCEMVLLTKVLILKHQIK